MVNGSLRVNDTDSLGPATRTEPKLPPKKEEEEELEDDKVSPRNAPARLKLIDIATAIWVCLLWEETQNGSGEEDEERTSAQACNLIFGVELNDTKRHVVVRNLY